MALTVAKKIRLSLGLFVADAGALKALVAHWVVEVCPVLLCLGGDGQVQATPNVVIFVTHGAEAPSVDFRDVGRRLQPLLVVA